MTDDRRPRGRGKLEEGCRKHKTNKKFTVFRETRDWIEHAARLVFDILCERVGEGGTAAVALAGGRTPQPVYQRLVYPPYRDEIPWESLHFFWGDERCVPFDDPYSNYGMARKAFLGRASLPPGNVHPVPVAEGTCLTAADHYEKSLRQFFSLESKRRSGEEREQNETLFPVFDLILLGLGEDGHTASLFPGNPALEEKFHWAVYVPESPQPPFVPRVTLTLPVINRARTVLFLVSGKDKREIVGKIRRERGKACSPYPAARIHSAGDLIWLIAET